MGVASVALLLSYQARRSPEAFCARLGTVADLDDVLVGGSPARAAERVVQLQELRSVAPEEVEPQVARLAAVTDDLARTLATTPDPGDAASEVFLRRQAELPEIEAAGTAVEHFASDHCQIVLNPTAAAALGPAGESPPTSGPPTTAGPAATSTRARPPATARRPSTAGRRTTTTRSRTTTSRSSRTTRRR